MPRRTAFIVLLVCCAWCGRAAGQATPEQAAMDFEVEGAWRTAPDLLEEFDEADLWSTRTIPFKDLAGGLTLSTEHVKSGRFAGKWSDHPRYPTLHTRRVPRDWGSFSALRFWAYSQEPTHEKITLAVESDSPETAWKDYFLYTFVVDWTGWKEFAVPFTDFTAYEKPAGWPQVGAVCFFAKIFDRQPNPYTVLYLDGLKLDSSAPTSTVPSSPVAQTTHTSQAPEFDPGILNHPYPETPGGQPVYAPIRYQPYFKAERALHGYFPRFQPGVVSFCPQGKPYLQYGSYILESCDEHGHWTGRNLLKEVIEPYARETLKFEALHVANMGAGNDASIRFDKDGDAYMLCYVSDAAKDWRSRTGLLLHSRDGLKTWSVYRLAHYMARFEKFVGHNHDCLSRPPVILQSQYFAPTTNFITIPEKQADGTLVIPPLTKVAEEAIPFIPHSGEANNAVTHGDKVFLVFAQLRVLPGRRQEDGVPNYAMAFDLKTRTFSDPALLGFGGINAKDDHNWPSLAADGKGILHVVINGHHNPFMYTHSTRPWSIAEWTPPVAVAKGTSYCGLVCDKNDTLYAVSRDSDPGYYFRLSLHRKKAGQPWEEPKHLVVPFKPYYAIYYHKLTIDPVTDRLFLSYWSQSASECLFKDEYLAYLYTWPDREKSFKTQNTEDGQARLPLGTYRVQPRKYQFYSAPPSEMTTLVSDDRGERWRLAVTDDFRDAPQWTGRR